MPTQVIYENLKRCRILRAQGYSDNDLLLEGFDTTTISRAFTAVSERNAVKIRCKECGRLFFRVNRAGHCLACEQEIQAAKNKKALSYKPDRRLTAQEIQESHPDILQEKPE
jgi:hypothetical protein